MHETSLVSGVITVLKKEAAKNNASRVKRVFLKLGKGPHNLEPDRVKDIFDLLAKGTLAEGAELIMEPGPPGQEDEIVVEKFEAVVATPDDSAADA